MKKWTPGRGRKPKSKQHLLARFKAPKGATHYYLTKVTPEGHDPFNPKIPVKQETVYVRVLSHDIWEKYIDGGFWTTSYLPPTLKGKEPTLQDFIPLRG